MQWLRRLAVTPRTVSYRVVNLANRTERAFDDLEAAVTYAVDSMQPPTAENPTVRVDVLKLSCPVSNRRPRIQQLVELEIQPDGRATITRHGRVVGSLSQPFLEDYRHALGSRVLEILNVGPKLGF